MGFAAGSLVRTRELTQQEVWRQAGARGADFWYFRHGASAGETIDNYGSISAPGVIQGINTGTPGYSPREFLESSNFQGTDEVRRDGGQVNSYPFSIAALVRPRNLTQQHLAGWIMDPTASNKYCYVALLGATAGDPVRAYHHSFGGVGDVFADTPSPFVVDGWHTVGASFTLSGSTVTATVHCIFPDGTYETASSSSSTVTAVNGMTRSGVGAFSDTTPFNTGDADVAWYRNVGRAFDYESMFFMHQNPGFMRSTTPALRVFSETTVTANTSPRQSQFDRSLLAPWPDWHDSRELARQHAETMEGILEGGLRSIGEVTLTANAASTVVEERRCGPASTVLLVPMTENAGGELGWWISNVGSYNANDLPSFTINHATDSRTDRTFRYFVVGSSGGLV